jgi:hypothetical protein
VDFLLEGFLIIEIDGLAFHLNPRQFKKEGQRGDPAGLVGAEVLLRRCGPHAGCDAASRT